uniref:Uncharacterized protein n=1 Tax=Arundo donax TaxID=35708 RepID=A0A0A9BX90_ARUDO
MLKFHPLIVLVIFADLQHHIQHHNNGSDLSLCIE